MRILIVTASLPYPLASGGAIRVFGILKGLQAAGHQLTLLSFADNDFSDTPLIDICEKIVTVTPPTRSKLDRVLTLLTTSRADIETRFHSNEFVTQLITLLQKDSFDLVQFEAIESATYLPLVREHFPQVKICFDTFNAEADLQRVIYEIDSQEPKRFLQAMYSWMQSIRIERYERDLCRLSDLVIAVSQEDQAILSRYRDDDKTVVLSSGIFVDDYAETNETVNLQHPAIVFTGKMDYRPNVDAMLWFTDAILPRLPDAHLTIVGQKPHPRIQHLPQQSNISLTGWVDTIPPYLYATDVYIAPLRMGGGTRLKILEAMASRCAIVATSIAAAGLNDAVKAAMVIADDEVDFANAIQILLDNPTKRAELGQQAQRMVKQHYDWSVLIPQLLTAYEEAHIG
ncbi:MAG: glycosyltransferase [Phototrophicaceae bacterium]